MRESHFQDELDRVFREESRYALASLIRILGDFDLAEEALQEAFAIASEKWVETGTPTNTRSWLVSTARFKAIDRIRREARVSGIETLEQQGSESPELEEIVEERIPDDLLRLIFICCHPILPLESQVALTLREVCGLTTGMVASAFLIAEPTMAQRMSRAKAKLRDEKAILEQPSREELEGRLPSVLRVVYLIFNEGYYASSGEALTSADISGEAIRLGELLAELMPRGEVFGLCALMCLSESRRGERERNGEIVLLEDQDRSAWNQELIASGNRALSQSLSFGEPGSYALQAQIASVHSNSPSSEETKWNDIVRLYDQLDAHAPSPVVKLNRAVAVAMAGDIPKGLRIITKLIDEGVLNSYGLAHAAQADLLRREGRELEARRAYKFAFDLAQMTPEKRFLQKRIEEINRSLAKSRN